MMMIYDFTVIQYTGRVLSNALPVVSTRWCVVVLFVILATVAITVLYTNTYRIVQYGRLIDDFRVFRHKKDVHGSRELKQSQI